MSNHAKSSWTTIKAPKVFLAIPRVREETFVLAFEIYKEWTVIVSEIIRDKALRYPTRSSFIIVE